MADTNHNIYVCKRCGIECVVEQLDYNWCECWCETCNDYAKGFNATKYWLGKIRYLKHLTYEKYNDKGDKPCPT